jgi:hypothetical protein
MPINIEEIKDNFDTKTDVSSLLGEIFSKSNVVMFLWFLAIYLVISFIMSSFSKDGEVGSMNLRRIMDLVAICGVGVFLFYGFFSKSQPEKEAYVKELYDGILKTIDNPISIFSIGVFIFVFYFSIYLLQLQMDSTAKPMSIAIIELVAWILMAATLIVTFFKFMLKIPLIDYVNNLMGNQPPPISSVPVVKSPPVPVLVSTPAISPSPAPVISPVSAPAPSISPSPAPSSNMQTQSNSYSTIQGNPTIYGNPIVSGNSSIYGTAYIFGNSNVYGNAQIFGNSNISGNTSAITAENKQGFADYLEEFKPLSDSISIPRSMSVLPPEMKPFSDELIMNEQKKSSVLENFNTIGNTKTAPAPAPASNVKNEVFNIASDAFTYSDAQSVCKAFDARLATYDEIEQSYNKGAEWCNYGWSDDQYVYMPTQKSTWMNSNPKDKCGRPGINGGKVDDPNERFGVNCYGKKPMPKKPDLQHMEMNKISATIPSSPEEDLFNMKVQFWKDNRDKLLVVNSFSKNKWSNY